MDYRTEEVDYQDEKGDYYDEESRVEWAEIDEEQAINKIKKQAINIIKKLKTEIKKLKNEYRLLENKYHEDETRYHDEVSDYDNKVSALRGLSGTFKEEVGDLDVCRKKNETLRKSVEALKGKEEKLTREKAECSAFRRRAGNFQSLFRRSEDEDLDVCRKENDKLRKAAEAYEAKEEKLTREKSDALHAFRTQEKLTQEKTNALESLQAEMSNCKAQKLSAVKLIGEETNALAAEKKTLLAENDDSRLSSGGPMIALYVIGRR